WPSGGAVALILFAKARANGARTQNPPPKTRNSTNRSLKSEPIIVPRECWTPPNGSRLSCGRRARRRKDVGRQSVPTRAQHSDSIKAITARQLQALVRQHLPTTITWNSTLHR